VEAARTQIAEQGEAMTAVMRGVRILEVAEHTFVPAASALLSDWGAEVIKVEHVERGDAMRGLLSSGGLSFMKSNVHVLLEHSNRGKQSIGLDLTTPEGLDVLYQLAATCDVFLTNKLPGVRAKLRIDVDDLRAHNPDLIYVRGTGQGERGPDADKGSYDSLAYWNRSGIAMGLKAADAEHVPSPPPAFGDSIGAMTIAGGIMGALFHRERTGEATVVDVSLLGVGMWSMGAGMALSLQLEIPWGGGPAGAGALGNPLMGNYTTRDGKALSFACLQPMRYWADACTMIGRPELATDERFDTYEHLSANGAEASQILKDALLSRDAEEWQPLLADFTGQWTWVQTTLDVVDDPQAVANGYLADCISAEGEAFQLVSAPVQYDGEAPQPGRAPGFNEHGDAILGSLGLDVDAIIDLKVKGVVA
jgi:crotonobetainyl-CoA:carnitine CoA-transferase CaiB-like acyl-CoA transferase